MLAEMRRAQRDPCEPVPWASGAARDEALASIRERGDIDEATRADLLEWVAATPFYEDA